MAKVLRDAELGVQLAGLEPGELEIVVYPAGFVNKLALYADQPHLVDRGTTA